MADAPDRLGEALKRIRQRLERVTPPGTLHVYATDICELLDALRASQQDTKRLTNNRLKWANDFIAWIGSGYHPRGRFPKNLTELSDDCLYFAAHPFDSPDARPVPPQEPVL